MTNQDKSRQIFELIKKSDNILLHLHLSPDADSIGSALAMSFALLSLGKKVTVIKGDSPLPERFSVLPGYDKIVHKNFMEIDLSQFDLFLILDSASLDRISKIGEVIFPETLKTAVIDHHVSNTNFAEINLVDSQAPAVAQMLAVLFKEWQITITPEIAICLLVGIYADTGGFSYERTTSLTFSIASQLVEIYPNFPKILSDLNNYNTPGSLRFRGLAYSSIEIVGKGQIGIIPLNYQSLVDNDFNQEDMEGQSFSSSLISVKDWLIGVSLIEKEPNKTRLSFRCRRPDLYDMSKVTTLLGGGGHPPAAGALFVGTATEAKTAVIKALADTFPDLF